MTKERKRTVEIIVCESHGTDSGAWWVWPIDVDVALPEEEAKSRALEIAEATIDPDIWVVHMGIYCYWDDDAMEGYWDECDDETDA